MADQEFVPTVPQAYAPTGEPVQIDHSQAAQLFQQGHIGYKTGTSIPVVSPYGEVGSVPSEQLRDALGAGYKLDTPDLQYQRFAESKYGTGGQAALATGEAALRGATLGLSDVAAKQLGFDTEAMRLRKEVNPFASGAGEFAGILGPALLSGGVSALGEGAAATGVKALVEAAPISLVTQGGRAIEGAVSQIVGSEAKSLAGKIIQTAAPKMAGSAIEGAIFGASNAFSEDALGQHELNAENLIANIGAGAMIGAGIGGGVAGLEITKPYLESALDKAKQGLGTSAKKAVGAFLGVEPQKIDDVRVRVC